MYLTVPIRENGPRATKSGRTCKVSGRRKDFDRAGLPWFLPVALSLAAIGVEPVALAGSDAPASLTSRHHVRVEPGSLGVTPYAAGNVIYGGGPVITRAQVVNVLWGNNVAPAVASGSDAFYRALIASNYVDCLGEYDTVGQNGKTTNQHIFRPTSVKTVTIQPMTVSGNLTNAQIEAELKAQISSNVLPIPAADAEGGTDTLFMLAFPPDVTIVDRTGPSCPGRNGWCAGHYTFSVDGVSNVPYAVLPDFSSGGCATGCGRRGAFVSFTSAAAHEFSEAETNPDRASGWTDSNGGEIADICENQKTIGTVGGYQVAQWWSNRLGKCISGDPGLPLCNGATRPCRPCSAQDCALPGQVCDTSATNETVGQCIVGSPDGGTGSGASIGSIEGGIGGSADSGGNSGSGMGIDSSGSGSGSARSSGDAGSGVAGGGSSGGNSGNGDNDGSSTPSTDTPTTGSGGCSCSVNPRDSLARGAARFAAAIASFLGLVARRRTRHLGLLLQRSNKQPTATEMWRRYSA